MKYPSIH